MEECFLLAEGNRWSSGGSMGLFSLLSKVGAQVELRAYFFSCHMRTACPQKSMLLSDAVVVKVMKTEMVVGVIAVAVGRFIMKR